MMAKFPQLHNKKLWLLAFLQIGLLIALANIRTPHALAFTVISDPGSGAATSEAPQSNSARFNNNIVNTPTAGTQVTPYFDIGNNTSNFNYQSMDLNIYVDSQNTGTFTVEITNAAPDCYSASGGGVVGPDYSQSGGAPGVTYTLLKAGNVPVPGAQTQPIFTGGCQRKVSFTVNVNNQTPYTMSGRTPHYDGYYVLRAAMASGGGQGENSFRTNITSGTAVIGYVGGPNSVAGIGYRDTDLNNGNYWNGWLAFGPVTTCSDLNDPTATVNGSVSWQDLDLNRTDWNPNPAPSMSLYEQQVNSDGTVTGNPWVQIEDYNGYTLRANGWDDGSFKTTKFKVGYRYRVVMSNFGVRNTVRLNFNGQIRGIGSNLDERPNITDCYKASCSINPVPAGPYTSGQNIQLRITVNNNANTIPNYGATWQPSTELLKRSAPSNRTLDLNSSVAPGGSATLTDSINVPASRTFYTYRMYTNSGATPMVGNSCSIPINGGVIKGPGPGGGSASGSLDVQCDNTYVRGVSVPATTLKGGSQKKITNVPAALQILDQNDGRSWTYLIPGGVPNGGDSAALSTFGLSNNSSQIMWPQDTYEIKLFLQGSVPPTASPNAAQPSAYPDNGNWNPSQDANQGGYYYGISQFDDQSVGQCISASCVAATPVDVEPGQSTRLNAGIQFVNDTRQTYNSSSVPGYGIRIDTSGGISPAPAPPVQTDNPIRPGTNTVNAYYNAQIDYTGSYTWTLLFADIGQAVPTQLDLPNLNNPCGSSATTSQTPATRPFLQVWGGDINTGGGFAQAAPGNGAFSCNPPTPYISPTTKSGDKNYGGIKTFAAADGSYGSLSDLGALSLGAIAKSPAGNLSSKPFINFGAQQTFANNIIPSAPGAPLGQLNSTPPDYCVRNFFDDSTQKVPPPQPVNSNVQLSDILTANYSTNQYISNGDVNNFAGGTVPSGGPAPKFTLYVDGNITITSNIYYADWNSTDAFSAPSFTLVVKGNINIAPGVTHLDGLYIAQPSASNTDGEFNTCADNTGNQFCNQELVVNGAVIARIIKPLRSAGTMSPDAIPSNGTAPGYIPAEIFNFVPSMILSSPNLNPTYNPLQGLFNLPPVF